MSENSQVNEIPGLGAQHRKILARSKIQSDSGDLTLEQEERTEISPDGGDIDTTTTSTSLEIDGEIVHNRSQIAGVCQKSGCGQYLTARTLRICGNPDCRTILCHKHAKFHAKEHAFFCLDCYRSVRIKRFFLVIAWVFVAPFVERVDR